MKAIITDLDRTLLHTDKSVSRYTLDVLEKCRKNGILVLAASARPLRSIRGYDEKIRFDAIATMNGAILYTPRGMTEFGIAGNSAENILASLCSIPEIFLSVETSGGLFSNREIPDWEPIVYDKFPALPKNILVYKILASSRDDRLYEQIQSMLTADVYHSIAHSGIVGKLVQIMSKQATKWNGVQQMLACFGISPDEAVYFGDDNDDIEPIRRCGIGIAMANSIPAVLDAANEVTESNDLDGVAKWIEKRIL